MNLFKCDRCGNLIYTLNDKCDGITCCGFAVKKLEVNIVDAAFEKHVPMYEILGDKISIYVNHVMEDDHYIEWILVDYGDSYYIKEFKPGDTPKVVVDYKSGMKAYSYCNKHSLWVNENIK